ncbi:MAG: 6-pyruvoyl tetrahydropterin synthase family protein [Bdellovibrionales bacterium]
MYTMHLAKEPFKFSCSHFTILSPTRAERLHGHNYQVRVEIDVQKLDPQLGLAFDFNRIKPLVRDFCESLDERILLPANSPFLKLTTKEGQTEAVFGNKRYSFPEEDTRVLPLANISAEELARFAGERLTQEIRSLPDWTSLRVNVEETRGQSVSYTRAR